MKWTQEELNLETGMDRARWSSVRYRFRSFSILWRHCTAVLAGEAEGQRAATESATSCQWVALRLPRRREYHLSRYESIRATVSSWDQHGGGSLREEEDGGVGWAWASGVGWTWSWAWADDDGGGGAGKASGRACGGPGGRGESGGDDGEAMAGSGRWKIVLNGGEQEL